MGYLETKRRAFMSIINQNSGIRKKVSGVPPLTLENCIKGNMIGCKIYGSTSASDTGVGDLTKNKIIYPFANTTKTINGVTLTDNKDGTITVSGTPTASVSYLLKQVDVVPNTAYYLSGIDVGKNLAFLLTEFDSYGNRLSAQNSRSINFTAAENAAYVKIYIDRISSNKEIPETIVKPQLEIGTSATEFDIGGKYKIPITVSGRNLFDQEAILPEQGWVKQEDGSFYTAVNTTVYLKKLWENTEGYTGRLKIDYRIKYLLASSEKGAGSLIRINYTDGTKENVLLLTNTWNAGEWNTPDYHIISNSKKTVDYIDWIYGTGSQSTWVKDIIITKDLSVDGYEPYIEPRTVNLYLTQPLKAADYADSASGTAVYSGDAESVSFPQIELSEGTNILSIGTEVLPSAVDAEYYSNLKEE